MTNLPHVIETALLLLIAFLIGCFIGYFLRMLFARPERAPATTTTQPAAVAVEKPALVVPKTPQMAKPETKDTPQPIEAVSKAKSAKPASVKKPVAKKTSASVEKSAETKTAQPVKTTAAKSSSAKETAKKPAVAKVKPEAKATAATPAKAKVSKAKKPVSAVKKAPVKAETLKKEAPSGQDKLQKLEAPRGGIKDDLKKIKGIGPKIETTLNGLGVYHFDQVAAWDVDVVSWVNGYLSFKGRVEREAWISQAKQLAADKA